MNKYFNRKGIAIGGYDVVALHKNQEVITGEEIFSFDWEGVTWRFSSESNLQLFRENPQRYAPAYGGYCAYGVSLGYKAQTDVHTFSIIGDRLYLNFSGYIKRYWRSQQEPRIKAADEKWRDISEDEPLKIFKPWIDLKYRFYKLIGKPFFEEL